MKDEYVTLMASLPALGPVLGLKRPPINRARLSARHGLLAPEHKAELDRITRVLAWRDWPLLATDTAFLTEARETTARLTRPTLEQLVAERLEMRTLVAALRRRHQGEEAPRAEVAWGTGRYLRRIRENWREPGFGVARAFPWVLEARDKLQRGEVKGLERVLLQAAWRQAARLGEGHAFDFEAVVLYTVRWALLERWTGLDAEAAAARFARLKEGALAALPHPLAPGRIEIGETV